MNISQKIKELDLPEGSYVVVGSGILNALNIRESEDIDLVVSDSVFKQLEDAGWQKETYPDSVSLKQGIFEVGLTWYGKTIDRLAQEVVYLDAIPYLSLETIYRWKKSLRREKDLRDIVLIEAYKARSSSTR